MTTQTPYTFEFLAQYNNNPPVIRLFRTPQVEDDYTKFNMQLKSDSVDITTYITCKYFSDNKFLSIDDNNFPYDIDPSCRHMVCWVNPKLAPTVDAKFLYEYVCKLLDDALGDPSKYIIWQNTPSNQSIKGVPHYHIFVQDINAQKIKNLYVNFGV
jgi:hypothetical protein